MEQIEQTTTIEGLLDRLVEAAREGETTSIGAVVEHIGERSFAPLLLLPGLVILAPVIGDIPGVPTLMGAIVLLVSAQLLLKREHIWLPDWLLERSVASGKVSSAVRWLRRPARFIDRWTKRRQVRFVRHAGFYAIVVACMLIAAATPAMEFVPFSANFAGVAISAFALALLAEDGVIAMVAIALCVATVGFVVFRLLS